MAVLPNREPPLDPPLEPSFVKKDKSSVGRKEYQISISMNGMSWTTVLRTADEKKADFIVLAFQTIGCSYQKEN